MIADLMLVPVVARDDARVFGACNRRAPAFLYSLLGLLCVRCWPHRAVGLLTHGAITRTSYYTHALTLALVPFLNEDLFFGGAASGAAAPVASAAAAVDPAADA